MDVKLIRQPGAWAPIAMSLLALAIVLAHIAIHGTAREADEGSAAHAWQLLMATQAFLVVLFAVRWLPRDRRQALRVIALQLLAALAACAPVFLLGL